MTRTTPFTLQDNHDPNYYTGVREDEDSYEDIGFSDLNDMTTDNNITQDIQNISGGPPPHSPPSNPPPPVPVRHWVEGFILGFLSLFPDSADDIANMNTISCLRSKFTVVKIADDNESGAPAATRYFYVILTTS